MASPVNWKFQFRRDFVKRNCHWEFRIIVAAPFPITYVIMYPLPGSENYVETNGGNVHNWIKEKAKFNYHGMSQWFTFSSFRPGTQLVNGKMADCWSRGVNQVLWKKISIYDIFWARKTVNCNENTESLSEFGEEGCREVFYVKIKTFCNRARSQVQIFTKRKKKKIWFRVFSKWLVRNKKSVIAGIPSLGTLF